MSVDFHLSFRFKGNRDYVHGTDIFEALQIWIADQNIGDIQKFELSFHKIIRSNLNCQLRKGNSPDNDQDFVALCRFRANNSDYIITMFEDKTPVSGRYEYSEHEITEKAILNLIEKKITLYEQLDHTSIERIVALNKCLLTTLFSDQKRKWYFGKIELNKDLANPAQEIEVQLVRNMGVRFTKSAVLVNGDIVGHIYFSMSN